MAVCNTHQKRQQFRPLSCHCCPCRCCDRRQSSTAQLAAYFVILNVIECNAKFLDKSLTSIQWLQSGEIPVVACRVSLGFHLPRMASAPGAAASASRQLKRRQEDAKLKIYMPADLTQEGIRVSLPDGHSSETSWPWLRALPRVPCVGSVGSGRLDTGGLCERQGPCSKPYTVC